MCVNTPGMSSLLFGKVGRSQPGKGYSDYSVRFIIIYGYNDCRVRNTAHTTSTDPGGCCLRKQCHYTTHLIRRTAEVSPKRTSKPFIARPDRKARVNTPGGRRK